MEQEFQFDFNDCFFAISPKKGIENFPIKALYLGMAVLFKELKEDKYTTEYRLFLDNFISISEISNAFNMSLEQMKQWFAYIEESFRLANQIIYKDEYISSGFHDLFLKKYQEELDYLKNNDKDNYEFFKDISYYCVKPEYVDCFLYDILITDWPDKSEYFITEETNPFTNDVLFYVNIANMYEALRDIIKYIITPIIENEKDYQYGMYITNIKEFENWVR